VPLKLALVGELILGLERCEELLVELLAVGSASTIINVEAKQNDFLALGAVAFNAENVSSTVVGWKP